MEYNDYLQHKRSSLFGKERDDHKYVARVLVKKASGKKGNQYRYFYDKAEYQKYLKAQQDEKKLASIVPTKKPTKDHTKTGKDTVSKLLSNKKQENLTLSDAQKYVRKGELVVKKNLTKLVSALKKIDLSKPKKFVEDVADKASKLADKLFPKKRDSEEKKPKEEPKVEQPKVEQPKAENPKEDPNEVKFDKDNLKVTLSNGKTKKFKNIDEYEDYKERLEYQKNEPDFMKNIPNIPDDEIYSKFDDQQEVNELYSPHTDTYSMNCGNCSAAYELRRRGYDVEAKPYGDDYNGTHARYFDYFEDAELYGIATNGEIINHSERFVRDYWGDDDQVSITSREDRDLLNYYRDDQSYTSYTISRAITKQSPPGSRGMIAVEWQSGGAHSIIYEVNNDGKVIIRDSQTWDEYELDELAGRVNKVRFCRTDNLELKKGILDAVEPNEDNKRKYYVDERTLYGYKGRR
jgi:hypothetical protein